MKLVVLFVDGEGKVLYAGELDVAVDAVLYLDQAAGDPAELQHLEIRVPVPENFKRVLKRVAAAELQHLSLGDDPAPTGTA